MKKNNSNNSSQTLVLEGLKNFIVLHHVKKQVQMPTVLTSFHSRTLADEFIKKIRRRNLFVCMKGTLKHKYPEIFYEYYPI